MKFELQSFGTSILRILNIATGKYIAMDSKGMLQTRVRLPILYTLLFFLNFFTCLEVVSFFNVLFFHKSFIQLSFVLNFCEICSADNVPAFEEKDMLLTKLNYLQQSKQQCQMKVGLSFAIFFFFFFLETFSPGKSRDLPRRPRMFQRFPPKKLPYFKIPKNL